MDLFKVTGILTYISAKYPGGVYQFNKDGGHIASIPSPSMDVILCHPSLPKEIKEEIEKHTEENIGERVPHIILTERTNNFDVQDMVKYIHDIDPYIAYSVNPAVAIITATNYDVDSEAVKKISDYLTTARGLNLAYIITKRLAIQVKGIHWDHTYKDFIPADEMEEYLKKLERGEI